MRLRVRVGAGLGYRSIKGDIVGKGNKKGSEISQLN